MHTKSHLAVNQLVANYKSGVLDADQNAYIMQRPFAVKTKRIGGSRWPRARTIVVNHTFQPALLAPPALGLSLEVALSRCSHGLENYF